MPTNQTFTRTLLKSKIHRATVTDADLEYEGSITLDPVLMRAADLIPFEQVDIYNISNGSRFQTYVIVGEEGSGQVCVNGAAAHLAKRDDLIIIASYIRLEDQGAQTFQPKIVKVNKRNRPIAPVAKKSSEKRLPGSTRSGSLH